MIMTILIILSKLGILTAYASIVWMILQFKKQDKNVIIEFDILSSIELSLGVGVGLVGLVSVIDPSTYTFTFVLCLISIILACIHRYRIILAGDQMILFGGKTHNIKEIKRLGTGMFTLKIFTKSKENGYKIYVPLTSNHVLKDRVQAKIKKKQ